MCVASCVPCHASKGLRHGATTHDCSCGIGITLRNSRRCSNSHCETWTCHTAIAASLPECAMMSFGLRSVVCTCGFILLLGLTTHAPVAHSSPPWLVSLAQRSGFGDCWSWSFLTPARLVCLQRFSRVCWCVCALYLHAHPCMPISTRHAWLRQASTSFVDHCGIGGKVEVYVSKSPAYLVMKHAHR